MNQKTLTSLACAGLGVWIQINCYLTFHRFLMVPILISAALFSCGMLLLERRKK